MKAYHGKVQEKKNILRQLRRHVAADELEKGYYWEDGKGCAVGCTVHSYESPHALYPEMFGIPEQLARLEDTIFEGLPNDKAKEWPVRFMSSIRVGADLKRVCWQFLHWLITCEEVNPGISHPSVRDAVKMCADAIEPATRGKHIDEAKRSAARSAASSAAQKTFWGAASSAARSAAQNEAQNAAYVLMSQKLLSLLRAA